MFQSWKLWQGHEDGRPGTLAAPRHEAQMHNSPLTTILSSTVIYYLPLNSVSENLKAKWERLQRRISVKFIWVQRRSFKVSRRPQTQANRRQHSAHKLTPKEMFCLWVSHSHLFANGKKGLCRVFFQSSSWMYYKNGIPDWQYGNIFPSGNSRYCSKKIPWAQRAFFPIDRNTKRNIYKMTDRTPPTKLMVHNISFYCFFFY